MGYGVQRMRRCILLISGLCAGFFTLWVLCAQITFTYFEDTPVLSLVPAQVNQTEQNLHFPFKIPGTTLIAEQIVSYDGLFSEGEETCNVTNVAALLIHNYGEFGIMNVQIHLEAEKVQFLFKADTIPAGARILVPEQRGMEFGPKSFTLCSGTQLVDKSDWQMNESIELTYPGMGEVLVTNLTNQRLTDICLYYKTYYPEADFYVGGTTQAYCIEVLEPGENIRIYPYNYAFGYSRFTRIDIQNPSVLPK